MKYLLVLSNFCSYIFNGDSFFVGYSLAGNDALFQTKEFKKNVGIDANILTKLDADAKGEVTLSISHETKKSIIFIGIGQ